jgi:hypothetical protein
MVDPNRNPLQQQQWTHIPYQPSTTSSRGSSSPATASPTPNQTYQAYSGTQQSQSQYPSAQRPGLTIHQYRPASPQAARSQYPVTAPFLVPRMPNAWPGPGSQPHRQQSGARSTPIDPRLMAGTQGTSSDAGPHAGNQRRDK